MAARRKPDQVPAMVHDSYATVEFEEKFCPVVAAAHKKIVEKIRKIVDEEFDLECGTTDYDLEEFDDLRPEKVAPVLL